MYTGPHIIKDGLVLGYDTGYGVADDTTATRFYKGQPATNLFTVLGSPSSADQNVTFAVQGTGTFKRVAVNTRIGNYKVKDTDVVYSYELGTNGCHYHGNDYSSVSSGTKVSFSIEYFLTSDVSIVRNYLGSFEQLAGVGGTWGSVNSQTGVWHKVSFTRTATSTGNLRMLMYPGGCGSNKLSSQGKIYYKNPTVTLTEQPVPFVDGTRSSTASLIDLKETTDIDVSNVTFDSTGQPEFDGSNDYIYIDEDILNVSNFTVEAIVNITSSGNNNKPIFTCGNLSSTGIWFLKHRSGLGNRLVMHGFDGVNPRVDVQSTNVVPDAENTHVAVTFNGTSYQIYINGVADGNAITDNAVAASTDNYIGRQSSSSTYLLGEVPVLKLYNKALSASEIKQNFNAYKNRFSI